MTSLVPIVERSFRHRCTFNFKASCSLCVCLCVCRLLCVCVLFPFQKMPVQVLQYRDITGIGQNPVSPVPEHRLDVISYQLATSTWYLLWRMIYQVLFAINGALFVQYLTQPAHCCSNKWQCSSKLLDQSSSYYIISTWYDTLYSKTEETSRSLIREDETKVSYYRSYNM